MIGIATGEGPDEVVHYFSSDEEAAQAFAQDKTNIQRALSAIGAWKHIDDEGGPDMLDELDRMRHETKPTPPFELCRGNYLIRHSCPPFCSIVPLPLNWQPLGLKMRR